MEDEFHLKKDSSIKARVLKDIMNIGAYGFFDDAAKDGIFVVGVVLRISNSHSYNFQLQCGTVSNMKVELLALWCLCKIASILDVVILKVYGDSRVTIKWEQG